VHDLQKDLSLDESISSFCRAMQAVLDFDHLTVSLLNSRSELVVRYVISESGYVPEGSKIDMENSATGLAVLSGSPGAIDDLSTLGTTPRFFQGDMPDGKALSGAMLILPVKLGDLTAGVITIESAQRHAFNSDSYLKARFFAGALAFSLNNLLLKDRIKTESPAEPETGTMTRKYFLDRLRHEINRTARQNGDLVLMLIEFDDRQGLLSRYGESVTGNLMRSTARLISASIRNYDLVSRVGAMRFAVCLTGITEMNARFWADKLREQIINFPFETDDQFKTILATTCIGLAKLRTDRGDVELLYESAEKALLHAQNSGGNTVKVF
jgi:diguanylate cyclase (GGDEF)-like protein